MRWWWSKAALTLTVALLAGCSALRLGYDQGPQLVWWWLDGYLDLPGEQAPQVKDTIREWFGWHRSTQLRTHAAWLASVRSQAAESVTPAQVCRWWAEARGTLDPALDRALVLGAPLLAGLGEAQIRHLEQRYAKNAAELRRELLQPKGAERRDAAIQRVVERAERLYGRLDEAQHRVIAEGVDASPWDAEAWFAERLQRQRETVQTLRRLVAERADADRVLAALRALAERAERSPDPAYRARQDKVADYNCGFAARVHNAAGPVQRRNLRERLEGWENDLRALAAAAP